MIVREEYDVVDRWALHGIGFCTAACWFLAGLSAGLGVGMILLFWVGAGIVWHLVFLFYANYAMTKEVAA